MTQRTVTAIVLALAVAGCRPHEGATTQPAQPVAPQKTAGPSPHHCVVEAHAAASRGDFAHAVELLRQALLTRPDVAPLWRRYEYAVLTRAAADYLAAFPDNRYRIAPAELRGSLEGTTDCLLDVREPREFAAGHVDGAVNVPFRDVLRRRDCLPSPRTGRRIIVICWSQHRANHVLTALRLSGYTNAWVLERGFAAWRTVSAPQELKPAAIPQRPPAPQADPDASAARALRAGRYDLAVDLLRLDLVGEHNGPGYWDQYDRALVARACTAYLEAVPDDRFRVNVESFARSARRSRTVVVDLRSRSDYIKGRIPGSIHLPFNHLVRRLHSLPGPGSSQPILLISNEQYRAIHALELLRLLGYRNARTLHGGYRAYIDWQQRPTISPADKTRWAPQTGAPKTTTPKVDDGEEEDFGC